MKHNIFYALIGYPPIEKIYINVDKCGNNDNDVKNFFNHDYNVGELSKMYVNPNYLYKANTMLNLYGGREKQEISNYDDGDYVFNYGSLGKKKGDEIVIGLEKWKNPNNYIKVTVQNNTGEWIRIYYDLPHHYHYNSFYNTGIQFYSKPLDQKEHDYDSRKPLLIKAGDKIKVYISDIKTKGDVFHTSIHEDQQPLIGIYTCEYDGQIIEINEIKSP